MKNLAGLAGGWYEYIDFAVNVDDWAGEDGIAPKPGKPEPGTVLLYDGMHENESPIRRVNVASPELCLM